MTEPIRSWHGPATCRHCGRAIRCALSITMASCWLHVDNGMAVCVVGLKVAIGEDAEYLVATPT